jgi:hypothetical protein
VKNRTDGYAFSIGRKCPRCGSLRLIKQPGQDSGKLLRHIPGVNGQLCLECGQSFFMCWGIGILREQRNQERMPTTNTLLARFRGKKPVFTRIEDISIEGIGVTCALEQLDTLMNGFAIDLYDCRAGTSLEGLPIEIVSSIVQVQTVAGQTRRASKIGARFLNLSLTQRKLLDNFIRKNKLTDKKTPDIPPSPQS